MIQSSFLTGADEFEPAVPVSETGALPLGYAPILARARRLEHLSAVLETIALPVELYPYMVMPARLELAIFSLRGWRPDQLDDGTLWRTAPDLNRSLQP